MSCLLKNGSRINSLDSSARYFDSFFIVMQYVMFFIRSPLDLAVCLERVDIIELLLDSGADMERVDSQGIRSIDRAIGFGDSAVVSLFLKRGAKIGAATWRIADNKPGIQLILLNKLLEDGNTLYRKNKLLDASQR